MCREMDVFFRVHGRVKYEELCTLIAEYTLATDADVACIVDALLSVTRRELMKGSIVQLGVLGNFRMHAGSCGVQSPEKFHTSMFKKARIIYTLGVMMKEITGKLTYTKASVKDISGKCPLPHVDD
ncbi:MAG: hypothetical protein LUH10_09240 [Tannerellaceae bacterium]|nr:hypothetical protein [Tannerellaceae bacterium]